MSREESGNTQEGNTPSNTEHGTYSLTGSPLRPRDGLIGFARPTMGQLDTASPPPRPTIAERWVARASESQFNAVSGAIGGFTAGIVTCPLDVIKTKLQAQGGFSPLTQGHHVGQPKLYNGLIGTAKVIWREEGIRGMYRGLGPIVMGYLPTWAVWFTVYNKSKIWMSQYQGKQPTISRQVSIFLWARRSLEFSTKR
jgi:solute carrier family 25 folate transporter 32